MSENALAFDRDKYEQKYKRWVNKPLPTITRCKCGEEFNGVGGGAMNDCPYCGHQNNSFLNYFSGPLAGALWSSLAISLGLNECFISDPLPPVDPDLKTRWTGS